MARCPEGTCLGAAAPLAPPPGPDPALPQAPPVPPLTPPSDTDPVPPQAPHAPGAVVAEPAAHAEDAGTLPHQHGRLRVRGARACHPPHPQHRDWLLKPCPRPAHPAPTSPRSSGPGCRTLQARGQGLWAAGPLPTSFLPPSRLSPGTEHPGQPLPVQGRVLASVFGHGCPSASAPAVAWSLSPRRPCFCVHWPPGLSRACHLF